MARVATTRRYYFNSLHALLEGDHREGLHGHRYELEVSFFSGQIESVDQLVKELVLKPLHGRELNKILSPATGEILVEWIDQKLRPRLPGLGAICLQETAKNRFVSAASEDCFV